MIYNRTSVFIKIVPKKYAKKRTSIGIEEDQMEKIIKVLMPNESLATFGKNALVNAISDRDRSRLALLSDTEQFHKIETMKKDIEELKWRDDYLEGELNHFKKEAKNYYDFGSSAIDLINKLGNTIHKMEKKTLTKSKKAK